MTLLPVVVRDARFRAGRTLVMRSKSAEATTIFVQLLDSARQTYGNDDIECAAAYYEYGNALFRSLAATQDDENEEEAQVQNSAQEESRKRSALADAAEKRAQKNAATENAGKDDSEAAESEGESNQDKKPAAAKEEDEEDVDKKEDEEANDKRDNEGENEGENNDKKEEDDDSSENDDDMGLSLEMMETAWSILDKHLESSKSPKYRDWGTEQLPRWMTGIGDVLSAMERFADAAEVYSQALKHRQSQWQALQSSDTTSPSPPSLLQLVCRRRMVDLQVLLAEQFLAAPQDQDVVTSETNVCLCKAEERMEYARGYYNKARDECQETVCLMGQLFAVKGNNVNQDELAEEKENICFTSTLLMHLGETLAARDQEELEQQQQDASSKPPAKKKSKHES